MIDLNSNDHTLEYECRKTGKVFKGKTIIPGITVSLIDPETLEKSIIGKSALRVLFKSSRNNKFKNKPERCCPARFRSKNRTGYNSKEWQEYLNGTG